MDVERHEAPSDSASLGPASARTTEALLLCPAFSHFSLKSRRPPVDTRSRDLQPRSHSPFLRMKAPQRPAISSGGNADNGDGHSVAPRRL